MDYIFDAKHILLDHLRKTHPDMTLPTPEEIFIIKAHYSIGSWKVDMATVTRPGYMFQTTHNPEFHETYLDVYVKESNSVYVDDGEGPREISTRDASSRPDVEPPECRQCGGLAVWSQGKFVCNNHDEPIQMELLS